MKRVFVHLNLICLVLGMVFVAACTDEYDRVSTSASDQPAFSADTIRLDTLFSRISSSTRTLMVYNRHKQAIRLSEIRLQGGEHSEYRVNIDGRTGIRATDLTILPGDSLYVFVEATFAQGADDAPTLLEDSLAFVCSGRTSYVLLQAFRQNVDEVSVLDVRTDHTIGAARPLVVRDSIVVQSGATLSLEPGARLLMNSEAAIVVYGRIVARGLPNKRICIESLRQDNLLNDLPYPLIPGQWRGISFGEQSKGNTFAYTTVRNAMDGMIFAPVIGTTDLRAELTACILTNMKGTALRATGGQFVLTNTELTNTLGATLDLRGCCADLIYCSIINFYPWDVRRGAAVEFRDYIPSKGSLETQGAEVVSTSRLFAVGCVVDGSRSLQASKPTERVGEVYLFYFPTDQPSRVQTVFFAQSFLRVAPSLDAGIDACMLADPKVATEYKDKRYYHSLGYKAKAPYTPSFIFDFRPLPTAPFVGKALPQAAIGTDLLGIVRPPHPTPGAYEPVQAE